jgi:hypothetical protein
MSVERSAPVLVNPLPPLVFKDGELFGPVDLNQ